MELRTRILDHLQKDARLTTEELGVMINEPEETVRQEIQAMEKDGTILAYKAITNPEKSSRESVNCLIEVSVQPERGSGFDAIAERIYRFPEVHSVFLLSGGYDLLIMVEGETIRQIADFVADKLSTLPNVRSTSSHFMLKKYKEAGVILVEHRERERMPVTP